MKVEFGVLIRMAWQKLDSVTNGSATTLISNDFDARTFLQTLTNAERSSSDDSSFQYNTETGVQTTHAVRFSENGDPDTTGGSQDASPIQASQIAVPFFNVSYIINIDSEEKLLIGHCVEQGTAGAANVPNRDEIVAKSTISAQITKITVSDSDGNANNFETDSNLSILGTD